MSEFTCACAYMYIYMYVCHTICIIISYFEILILNAYMWALIWCCPQQRPALWKTSQQQVMLLAIHTCTCITYTCTCMYVHVQCSHAQLCFSRSKSLGGYLSTQQISFSRAFRQFLIGLCVRMSGILTYLTYVIVQCLKFKPPPH